MTQERIITLIKAGKPESQIRDLIRYEGLAFKPTAASQSEIREAGGDASLTFFIYRFSQEHGGAAESAVEAKARGTSSQREGGPVVIQAQETRNIHPFLSLAYTAGGDSLATVQFSDGSSSSIKAGGETLIKGGLEYQVFPAFSLQASYGYHTDSTKQASNGSLDFKRSALEFLGHYWVHSQFRLGGGFRKTSGARLTGSGAATIPNIDFDSSTGLVVEGEFLTHQMLYGRGGLSLRYVSEKYTPSSVEGFGSVSGPSVDGSHFGLGFSWYF